MKYVLKNQKNIKPLGILKSGTVFNLSNDYDNTYYLATNVRKHNLDSHDSLSYSCDKNFLNEPYRICIALHSGSIFFLETMKDVVIIEDVE